MIELKFRTGADLVGEYVSGRAAHQTFFNEGDMVSASSIFGELLDPCMVTFVFFLLLHGLIFNNDAETMLCWSDGAAKVGERTESVRAVPL